MSKNIMIVGVGGQGTLLASKILGRAAMDSGLDVKVSEVHGMSQRGGSVVTYVRFGDEVYSPVIGRGDADVILSFELLEAARWLPNLKNGGVLVTSTQQINPMPVITGAAEYPEGLIDDIKALGVDIRAFDAPAIAAEAGNARAANVALIGLAADALGFDTEILRNAVAACVPEKALEVNMKAFDLAAARAAEAKRN
ncbi:MAG: indolepyruvate oxidoreductase subunit beta [Clostridia bacterium]|nr:indolepyruvate oxidoreductase subunit beta [Clostridia bacterium]MBQ3861065.1 indolepyruvate oxidoreductase subunit beta [Clostridia bacterium]MBQ3954260.1 indolepyruvate oxidoreductase subunit beta [Clostridia bacterium]